MSGPPAPTWIELEVDVNGSRRSLRVRSWRSLCDLLAQDLRLPGTTNGCAEGVCGSCTVLLDDEPVRSCLVLAGQVGGRRVETVESLATDGELNELQRAFRTHGAVQCGFCTPGFLMTGTALLRADPAPGEETVRGWLDGNLCRCTGYAGIVQAVQSVADRVADRADSAADHPDRADGAADQGAQS